jgi:hypothetical protein
MLIESKSSRARRRALEALVSRGEGGIYKRIDENRELLELLINKAPQVLVDHPQVKAWLASQDRFLLGLLEAVGEVPDAAYKKRNVGHLPFPREWPGNRRAN